MCFILTNLTRIFTTCTSQVTQVEQSWNDSQLTKACAQQLQVPVRLSAAEFAGQFEQHEALDQ
jgi:hypothetical protein